jgi:hypothetical protein
VRIRTACAASRRNEVKKAAAPVVPIDSAKAPCSSGGGEFLYAMRKGTVKTSAIATTHPAILMIAAAVIALCCSCTKGPEGLSPETYAGLEKTIDAMRRANEYRDSGVLLFEPRFLELERAVDDIALPDVHSVVTEARDDSAKSIARSCVQILKTYRSYLLDLAPRPGDTGFDLHGSKDLALRQRAEDAYLQEYTKQVNEMRQDLDRCVVTLRGYL